MQRIKQGLERALLFVLLLGLSGCSGKQEIVMSGNLAGQETTGSSREDGFADNTIVVAAENLLDSDAAAAESESSPDGYVYVCGAVEQPGVYPVSEGMRVFEAVALAGGFSEDADQLWLNQAETVQDGQRLYVYTKEETELLAQAQQESGTAKLQEMWQQESRDMQTAASDASDQKINLNTADRDTLMTLPGIGEVKADAVIQYREMHGAFSAIEEIQNIPGIKNAVFSKIKDLITV